MLQLFNDLTPNSAAKIEAFVTSGYYNGKNFPRISNFGGSSGYILQAGSANSDGSGSSGNANFNNEIVQQLGFTNPGELALANAGKSTPARLWSIPTIPSSSSRPAPRRSQRRLHDHGPGCLGHEYHERDGPGGHGETRLHLWCGPEKSLPVDPVNITSATLSTTNPDGVLHIDTTQARVGETSTITVTATDPATGTSQVQSFPVTVVANPNAATIPLILKPIASSATQPYTRIPPRRITLAADPAVSGGSSSTALTYTITTQPAHGTISGLNSSTGSLTYTPSARSTRAMTASSSPSRNREPPEPLYEQRSDREPHDECDRRPHGHGDRPGLPVRQRHARSSCWERVR